MSVLTSMSCCAQSGSNSIFIEVIDFIYNLANSNDNHDYHCDSRKYWYLFWYMYIAGGVVWRVKCSDRKLVCAVGSRNGIEDTKLLVLDFDVY